MIGYKAFNNDLTGYGGFQYEVGKTYVSDNIEDSHFYFCQIPLDVDIFYRPTSYTNYKYALIEASGKIIHETDIYCSFTDNITIIKLLSHEDLINLCIGELKADYGSEGSDILYFKDYKLHRDNDLPAIIRANGTKMWYYEGKKHRENNLPAIIDGDSMEWYYEDKLHRYDNDQPAVMINRPKHGAFRYEWFKNGLLHRDNDLPAIIDHIGNKEWYYNGVLHRDNDLPAVITYNGYKAWYVNGKNHRIRKPAVIKENGDLEWYNNGNRVSVLCSIENGKKIYLIKNNEYDQ